MPGPRAVRAKVVVLGAPRVGKTSLVRRFVHSIFSEDYHSTLGVKVDRKKLDVHGCEVTLLLWDMHGETDGLDVPDHYLRGASASLAVFDSMRLETVTKALELQDRVKAQAPNVTQLVLANKSDLGPDIAAVQRVVAEHGQNELIQTSALNGDGVEEAFSRLAHDVWRNAGGVPD